MGVVERKIREKAERRMLIMRCAKELILEQGVEKVSLQNIAGKAELSKGTLYLYFSSKEALFQDICNEAALQFSQYFQSKLYPGVTALEALKLYWSCFLDLFGKGSDLVMLFHMRRFIVPNYPFISPNDGVQNSSNPSYPFFNMIKNLIEQGMEEGIFDPQINPIIICHTILSIFSLIVENPGSRDAESGEFIDIYADKIEEMRNIFQIMLRGIAHEDIDRTLLVLGSSIKKTM